MKKLSEKKIIEISMHYEVQRQKIIAYQNAIEQDYHERLEALHQATKPGAYNNEWIVAFREAQEPYSPEAVEEVAKYLPSEVSTRHASEGA